MVDETKNEPDKASFDFESALAAERRERELSFVAQEHRLLPAIGNLAKAWSHPDPEMRSELWPKAVQALFWCLLPRPVTAGLSLITIVSIVLTWWQTNLMVSQSQQMQVQNSLAEAQRRTAMMSDSSEIFRLIETEKSSLVPSDLKCTYCPDDDCKEVIKNKCWMAENFVPSESTVGRVVSLTHALQPYRYLKDDDDQCIENGLGEVGDQIADVFIGGGLGRIIPHSLVSLEAAQAEVHMKSSSLHLFEGNRNRLSELKSQFFLLVDPGEQIVSNKLTCRPTSPERGQLLISLAAARVAVSEIVRQGANFDYAEVRGRLNISRLTKPSLRYASFKDVDFGNSILGVADLSYSDLRGAEIKRYNFMSGNLYGARIDVDEVSARSIAAMMVGARGMGVVGLTSFSFGKNEKEVIYSRWCYIKPKVINDLKGSDVRRSLDSYSLLTEIRSSPRGGFNERGMLLFKSFDGAGGVVFKGYDSKGDVEVVYRNLDQCKKLEGSDDL